MKRISLPLSKIDAFIFGLVLLLGISLRFYRLGSQGIFIDEAWSWGASRLPLVDILRLTLQDPHPPLYYLLLKGVLLVLPEAEAGLRALGVAFSLAGLVTLMGFATRWWNPVAGVFAGGLLALSSFDIYYAQEARMYTLMAFLWLLSYAVLVEAAESRPRLLLIWAGLNILLSLTHVYGLVVVYGHLLYLTALWAWYTWQKKTFLYARSWFCVGILVTVIGTLPVVYWANLFRNSDASGTSIPTPRDFLAFFSLVSTGLSSAREYFLDSERLVLPVLSSVPLWAWACAGAILAGFAFLAMRSDWYVGDAAQRRVLLALPSFLIPVLALLVLMFTQRRLWAFRPLLGAAYVFYLWSGAGISRLPSMTRTIAGVLVLTLGVIALIPYYTGWSKSSAQTAFSSLPDLHRHLVLVNPNYYAPIAKFYLGADSDVWGITRLDEQRTIPVKIGASGILPADHQPARCSDPAIQSAESIWVYARSSLSIQDTEHWPPCFTKKPLYIFESGKWVLLSP